MKVFESNSAVISKGISLDVWSAALKTEPQRAFAKFILQEAIRHCIEGNFIMFDAQTTSNCCHGISVLARELILEAQKLDLIELAIQEIYPDCIWDLAGLHLLTLIIDLEPNKGRRTNPVKLRAFGNIGRQFCDRLVKALQKAFSNQVALSYHVYGQSLSTEQWIDSTTVGMWSHYVSPQYIRCDSRGQLYAPCFFSMQVLLAFLSYSQATIALVNDVMDSSGKKLRNRYVRCFKGDLKKQFVEIDVVELPAKEPVIVLGGYVLDDEVTLQGVENRLAPWTHQLASFILACEIEYPQFPKVALDPNFDNTPIIPEEYLLLDLIQKLSVVKGVTQEDPSLFCFSHIFVASPMDLRASVETKDSNFPASYICYNM